ncbi:MAG: STAS domain-containing protein [Methylocystis sp.]
MDLAHEVSDGLLVIRPKGRIDGDTAAIFEARCGSLIGAGPAQVIVDFADVEYISSAGLRALLVAAKTAKSLGGALTLCGLKGSVGKVMSVSGFDTLFGAHAGVSEAATALRG